MHEPDGSAPVEIADRVWRVGSALPDDPFQCHVYLIEHGDQSVLVDPGSVLTWEETRKVDQVVGFDNVRYFVCHHADPDITTVLPQIEARLTRADARIVTHSRSAALIQHYGLRLPYWCVDEHDWQLDLEERRLRFVFTPYLHFSGSFCTLDEHTGTLFSSDLFGGFTDEWRLVARDASYFEAMRPFHEHYMPSREHLAYGIGKLRGLPIRLMAPQHGSTIPEPLVRPMMDRLAELDCGLFLLAEEDSDVHRLSAVAALLRDTRQALLLRRAFDDVVAALVDALRVVLPVQSLVFHARLDDGRLMTLSGERAVPLPPRGARWLRGNEVGEAMAAYADDTTIVLPLSRGTAGHPRALAVLQLSAPARLSAELRRVLLELALPLEVMVERELVTRVAHQERELLYQRSTRDSLTGLYNRQYMQDAIGRLFAVHEREGLALSAVLFDLDHFKRVNDRFGHLAGDEALRAVAAVIFAHTRRGDVAVRLGGEEFALFVMGARSREVKRIAERIRVAIARLDLGDVGVLTVSAGIADRRPGEQLEALLDRADAALYDAKRAGRNRVAVS